MKSEIGAMAVVAAALYVYGSGNPYGACAHVTRAEPTARTCAMLREAGIGWVRCDFDWNQIETKKGEWSFAMLRNGGFVNAASHADVRSPCRSHHGNPRRGADGKYRGSRRPATEDLAALSIDHIYYTKGIHGLRHRICMDQEALDVSDHSPVLLTFALD